MYVCMIIRHIQSQKHTDLYTDNTIQMCTTVDDNTEICCPEVVTYLTRPKVKCNMPLRSPNQQCQTTDGKGVRHRKMKQLKNQTESVKCGAAELDIWRAAYLDIPAAGNLTETLLTLQRLVHLVVGHTEHAQLRLVVAATLGKHHKVHHEWHHDCLRVQLRCHGDHITRTLAVDQPEPAQNDSQSQPEPAHNDSQSQPKPAHNDSQYCWSLPT